MDIFGLILLCKTKNDHECTVKNNELKTIKK
ncbi:hypothetical protein M2347_002277 [Chryseobacterium sp. H1D6B]|nr:hypothetical protein [Chryseobacterium sp. H1D6B]